MYLPLHNVDEKKAFISLSFEAVYLATAALPVVGFVACIFLTMYKDFERANNTHCNVPNVFPSISASIGSYSPQIYIWQIAIYLHTPGRFFTSFQRLSNFKVVVREELLFLAYLSVVLNVFEIFFLLGLTYWTSSIYYQYHELCFKSFMACSLLHMALVCALLMWGRRRTPLSVVEQRSLVLKRRYFLTNAVSFACAAYFFLRHSQYCEPYMYSMFGVAEYVVVLSNIGFHYTSVYDFHRQTIHFTNLGIFMN